jgi:hypothetical protein
VAGSCQRTCIYWYGRDKIELEENSLNGDAGDHSSESLSLTLGPLLKQARQHLHVHEEKITREKRALIP